MSGAGWAAKLPGALGEDGGRLVGRRRWIGRDSCAVCGRRAELWTATVQLPRPFPVLDLAWGCTREHAAYGAPSSWYDVAEAFAVLAGALREGDDPGNWRERLAGMRGRQAERAL